MRNLICPFPGFGTAHEITTIKCWAWIKGPFSSTYTAIFASSRLINKIILESEIGQFFSNQMASAFQALGEAREVKIMFESQLCVSSIKKCSHVPTKTDTQILWVWSCPWRSIHSLSDFHGVMPNYASWIFALGHSAITNSSYMIRITAYFWKQDKCHW